MRFEIDTVQKTIIVMETCTIQELNELMRKFIGEKEMKEYRITFKASDIPFIIPQIPNPYPWGQPWSPNPVWPNQPYIQYGQDVMSHNYSGCNTEIPHEGKSIWSN